MRRSRTAQVVHRASATECPIGRELASAERQFWRGMSVPLRHAGVAARSGAAAVSGGPAVGLAVTGTGGRRGFAPLILVNRR